MTKQHPFDDFHQRTPHIVYKFEQDNETKNCPNERLCRLLPRDRLHGSEICRRLHLRQMGKH